MNWGIDVGGDGDAMLLHCDKFKKEFTSNDLVFGRCPYCGAKIDMDQLQTFCLHAMETDDVLHEGKVIVRIRGSTRSGRRR
jgi:hypothetical protein